MTYNNIRKHEVGRVDGIDVYVPLFIASVCGNISMSLPTLALLFFFHH